MATNIRINYDVIFNDLIKARKEIVELQKSNDVLRQKNKTLGDSFNRLNQQAKQTSGGMGNLRNNLVSLGAALGVTSGVFLFANALRNAGRTVVDFQKQNAVLAGVLGKQRNEITALTSDAERLGSITAKTASEVTALQIALARLGFTQQEIINLTEPLINGSIALNAELDQTAELVGAVVRTFDAFDTLDAPEIIDKLTLATQRSALNFGKLQTALPIVAGAANAAGVDFSKLLALLGKLADAGIDTSTSATSLRNIFIDAAAKGLNYSEILQTIATSSDQLTASTDEFGRRTAVSASVISNQLDALDDLEAALNKAGGTAQKVAEEQLNTLQGRLELLSSAFEGLILSIESGDGAIAAFASSGIDAFAETFNIITAAEKGTISYAEALNALLNPITRTTTLLKIQAAQIADNVDSQIESQNDLKLAQILYNSSVEAGINTFEEFNKILGENTKNQQVLNEVQRLYNDKNKEVNSNIETQIALLAKLKADLKEEVRLREAATSEGEIARRNVRIEQIKEEIQGLLELNNQVERGVGLLDRLESKSADFLTTYEKDLKNVQEAFREVFGDPLQELSDKTLEKADKGIKDFFKKRKKEQEDELKDAEAKEERKQQLLEQGFNFANDLQNRLTQNAINNARREFEVLELQKEAELALAGDNADQRAKIEEKFAQKAIEAKIREAKAEKVGALFSIAINTAAAIIKQLAATPLPFGAPLVAAIAATGAAQGAVVAAQPLPKFRQGGQVGGRRHEQGGTLIEAEKGEFILRREAVDKYGLPMLESLNNMNLSPSLVVMNDNKELAKLFKERPENKLIWDENGFQSYTLRKGNIIQKKAKRYSI